MEKRIKKLIIVFVLLVFAQFISFLFQDKLLNSSGILLSQEKVSLKIHVRNRSNIASNGRRVYITDIKDDAKSIDLSDYNSDEWVWYDQYDYLVFEGNNDDLVIDINKNVDLLELYFFTTDGSGIADICINDKTTRTIDLFTHSKNWGRAKLSLSFRDKSYLIATNIINGLFIGLVLTLLFLSFVHVYEGKELSGAKIGLAFFNAAKGMGILLVILAHVRLFYEVQDSDTFSFSGNLFQVVIMLLISYGLIPLFFMISGFGFRAMPLIQSIKKQFGYILKPYLCLATISTAFIIVRSFLLGNDVRRAFLHSVLTYGLFAFKGMGEGGLFNGSIGPVWYCFALAGSWLILSAIMKINVLRLRVTAVIICGFASYVFYRLNFHYFGIGQALMAVPFLYAGYLVKQRKVLKNNSPFLFLFVVVSGTVVCFVAFSNSIIEHAFLILGKNYLIGYIISLIIGFDLMYLYTRLCGSTFVKTKLFTLFNAIGAKTLDILFVHSFCIIITPWAYLYSILPGQGEVLFIENFLIQLVLTGVIYYIVSFIKRRVNYGKIS